MSKTWRKFRSRTRRRNETKSLIRHRITSDHNQQNFEREIGLAVSTFDDKAETAGNRIESCVFGRMQGVNALVIRCGSGSRLELLLEKFRPLDKIGVNGFAVVRTGATASSVHVARQSVSRLITTLVKNT